MGRDGVVVESVGQRVSALQSVGEVGSSVTRPLNRGATGPPMSVRPTVAFSLPRTTLAKSITFVPSSCAETRPTAGS